MKDAQGRQLLLNRKKAPNQGCWSPIGGKVDLDYAESPFECAIREAKEEAGLNLTHADLHLFGLVTEKSFEGKDHWLLFLFSCHQSISGIPADIDEGSFGLFTYTQMESIPISQTDKTILWPLYHQYHNGFICLKLEYQNGRYQSFVEQSRT